MMSPPSMYWYDFETFGSDPRTDRVCQFAGIRTDEDLNIISEPLVIYCKPSNDFLPNPFACLITGITPQKALSEGINEVDFAQQINREFSAPGTCVAGYNNIRFDDELMRRLLYRNFFDPYEREYKNGNSRWDIIDMLRLCGATRPEGINWPKKENGTNSFKLDELTIENNIDHKDAHDALADVFATIEMARLVKRRQPKLYTHVFKHRQKNEIKAALDLVVQKPMLHVSMHYSAKKGCLGLVLPICPHPTQSNRIIVYDLSDDPSTWINREAEHIRNRINTKQKVPLKVIPTNSCPVLVTPKILSQEQQLKYFLDIDSCLKHAKLLQSNSAIKKVVAEAYKVEQASEETDPDFMIYAGNFFDEHDKKLMVMIRNTNPADLGRLDLPFHDNRLPEMFFRYRARNFNETLSEEELNRWDEFRRKKFKDTDAINTFKENLQKASIQLNKGNAIEGEEVLSSLNQYAIQLEDSLKL